MAVEAAHLYVSVTADVDKATRGLGQVNQAAEKSSGFLKGAASSALGFGAAMLGMQAGAAVFGAVKGGIIDMNATLETSTLQFETLMGDADKAEEHVRSLFDFAAKTPFETGPIIEASRLMETFGGAALNSKENLTTFGDAAAATGQPINEVAFWMSRAYAAIQAGKPWGEAAMRLGEMGVVTPQVRAQLEELQASGADGPAVWEALTGSMDKFGGAMEKQAGTFDGMMATLSDSVGILLANTFKPLFEGLKNVVGWLNELMASPGFNGALAAAVDVVGQAFDTVTGVLSAVWDAVQPIITAVGSLIEVFQSGDDVVGGFAETFDNLHEKVLTAIQGIIDWVINEGVPMAAEALSQFGQAFIEWLGPAAEALGAALPLIAENIINFLSTNLPIIAGKLVEWAGAFVGWIGEHVLPRLPGMLAAVGGAIVGWIAQTVPVVVARIGAMAGAMVEKLGAMLPGLPAKMGEALGAVFTTIVNNAPGIIGKMIGLAGDLLRGFISVVANLAPKFLGFLGDIVRALPGLGADLAGGALRAAGDFVNGFIKGMGSLPGKIFDKIRAAFRSINFSIGPFHISASGITVDMPNIKLPSFATGAWNLPRDMVAQVHAGEMIVPRDLAERLRGGGGFGGSSDLVPRRGSDHGGGDGGQVFVFNIGTLNGDQNTLDRLQEAVADAVRAATPRRTATIGDQT